MFDVDAMLKMWNSMNGRSAPQSTGTVGAPPPTGTSANNDPEWVKTMFKYAKIANDVGLFDPVKSGASHIQPPYRSGVFSRYLGR